MKPLRVLCVSEELAPLTGTSDFAREIHFLSRAMSDVGAALTMITPGYRVQDPSAFGLAQRLDSLIVHADDTQLELTVYEGTLAGGKVAVYVVSFADEDDAASAPPRETFARAALALAEELALAPDVVCACPGSQIVLDMVGETVSAAESAAKPTRLFIVRDMDDPPSLEGALPHSDIVTVASPGLAKELRAIASETSPPKDSVLSPLLASARDNIYGVVAGIDPVEWNPARDGLDMDDIVASKLAHKRALKRKLGLRGGAQAPLTTLVGPFEDDILTDAVIGELLTCDTAFVLVASDERDTQICERVARAARRDRVAVRTFDSAEQLRKFHRTLLCAADFAIFAHRYRHNCPSELFCMPYGVAPIAPRSPGYEDVITEFERHTCTGSGFLFSIASPGQTGEPAHGGTPPLVAALERAMHVFNAPDAMANLIQRLATFDLSWRTTAARYLDIIERVRPMDASHSQGV